MKIEDTEWYKEFGEFEYRVTTKEKIVKSKGWKFTENSDYKEFPHMKEFKFNKGKKHGK
jgi:hypothetical protein